MPNDFYNFISEPENFKTLNKLKLKFQDANEIVKIFADDKTQFQMLKNFLSKNSTYYQFVFGNLFLKCFARIDDYSVKNKTEFDSMYKIYLSQKNVINWQKNAFFQEVKEEVNDGNKTPLNLSEVDDIDLKFLEELKTQNNNNEVVEKTAVDGTLSEKIKNKKRKRVLTDEKIKKRNEKKKKLEKKFEENEKKMEIIRGGEKGKKALKNK